MSFNEIFTVSWKSISSNKSRSLLTMLGVIIGVGAVIVMMSVSAGTEAAISSSIDSLGSNLVFISGANQRGGPNQSTTSRLATGLVYSDVAAIQSQVSGIAGISVEQQASETVKAGGTVLTGIAVDGTTTDYPIVRGVTLQSGRFFNTTEVSQAQKVVVLGNSIAYQLFGNTDPIGQTIVVGNDVRLTVIGVLAPKSSASTSFDSMIYTPIQVVFQKFTSSEFSRFMGDRVRTLFVSVDPTANMTDVIQQMTILLAKRHNVTADAPDFTITTQDDIISTQEATTATFRTLLAWVAGISLVVGGIGIMNIMLVSVSERTREIGLRQAIGATPGDIQIQFLTEAIMLSMTGGILGVLLGVGGSYLFGKFGGMPTVIVPFSIVLSFASSAFVGVFFGFIPAQTAAKLDPIIALRHN